MKLNQKGFGLVEGLMIAVLVAAVGFGGFYVWNENKDGESASYEEIKENQDIVVTNFKECEDWAYPVQERDGVEYCVGPDGTEHERERSEELEEGSTSTGWAVYSNDELGFSFEYPEELGSPQESIFDGYEGAGKSLSVSLQDDVWVIAHTSDYNIGPKGPIPFSAIISNGYEYRNDKLYYANDAGGSEVNADKIENMSNFIYIENTITFQGDENPVEHMAVFNTNNGGLVILTENPNKVKLVKDIAGTVRIN